MTRGTHTHHGSRWGPHGRKSTSLDPHGELPAGVRKLAWVCGAGGVVALCGGSFSFVTVNLKQ